MEPEGIVDVLRDLCEGLVPGGTVVDLQSVRPTGLVEVEGDEVGRLDDTAFHARAVRSVAGLDALVDEGMLLHGEELTFEILTRFATGAELVDLKSRSEDRRVPDELARLLADVGACAIRETNYVRILLRTAV